MTFVHFILKYKPFLNIKNLKTRKNKMDRNINTIEYDGARKSRGGMSPLRKKSKSPQQNTMEPEVYSRFGPIDEQQELQRQEELRRQIALKESQLAKMRSTTEQMKQRLARRDTANQSRLSQKQERERFEMQQQAMYDQRGVPSRKRSPLRQNLVAGGVSPPMNTSLEPTQRSPTDPVQIRELIDRVRSQGNVYGHTQPLRSKSKSRSPVQEDRQRSISNERATDFNAANWSQHGYQSRAFESKKKDDRNPGHQRTISSGPRDRQQYQSMGHSEYDQVPHRLRTKNQGSRSRERLSSQDLPRHDRIQSLAIDNQSLKHRLKIVQKEIDRVKFESKMAMQQLDLISNKNESIEGAINGEGELDIINNRIRDELQIQRTNNDQISKTIEQENFERKNAQDQVAKTQNNSKTEMSTNQQLSLKLSQMEDKIHQQDLQNMDIAHRVNTAQTKFNDAEVEFKQIQNVLDRLDDSVKDLQVQRNDIFTKLEQQAMDHQNGTSQLRREKNDLESSNRLHQQLMASKILYNILVTGVHNRRQYVLNEIQLYCRFDKNCLISLNKLARIMSSQGKFIQTKALDRWYFNALKPVNVEEQNIRLAKSFNNNRLKLIAFRQLVNEYQVEEDKRNMKKNAMENIFHMIFRSNEIELKRGMTIWSETMKQEQKKEQAFKRIWLYHNKQRKKQVFKRWVVWSKELDFHCRIELLKRSWTHKLYETSLHTNMRVIVASRKKMRLLRQGLIFKSWKDYIARKDYQYSSSVLTGRFIDINKKFVIQWCFNALRRNKQRRKQRHMVEALDEDMNTALLESNTFLLERSEVLQTSCKKQASNVVRDMLAKRLFGYFNHWKIATEQYNIHLKTKLNDRILAFYKQFMGSYFLRWKNQKNKKKKGVKKKMMMTIEMESDTLQKELVNVEAENKSKAQAVSSAARKSNTRIIQKLLKRWTEQGFIKWAKYMDSQRRAEAKAAYILQRLRKNMVGQMFNKYKNQIHWMKKMDVNQKRTDNMINNFRLKALRKQYTAWIAFTHYQKDTKKKLGRIMRRLFNLKQSRHFKKWANNGKTRQIEHLEQGQNQLAQKMGEKNTVLGEFQQQNEQLLNQVDETQDASKDQARKQLFNYYKRSFFKNLGKAWGIWKSAHNLQMRRDAAMQKCVMRLRRKMFDTFKAMVKQHVYSQKKREKRAIIRTTEIQNEEIMQGIKHGRDTLVEAEQLTQETLRRNDAVMVKSKVVAKKPKIISKQKLLQDQQTKLLDTMIYKNHFMSMKSKKRAVWEAWVRVGKNQKKFHELVFRVLDRSFCHEGFIAIQEQARRNWKQDRLSKITMKYYKRIYWNYLRDIISDWKKQTFQQVSQIDKAVKQENSVTIAHFDKKIVDCKDRNGENCIKYFNRTRKWRIWKAWQEVRFNDYWKVQGAMEAKQVLSSIKQKRAVVKWFMRTQETLRFRFKWDQVIQRREVRVKRMIFEGLQWKRAVNKDMAKVVGNLENFMRTKMLDDCFKDIKSFYLSKKLATDRFKRRACYDIYSFLNQRHEKISRMYFHRYWHGVFDKKYRKARLKIIFGKINAQRRHKGFRRWVEAIDYMILKQEVNEVGPITEHVFEANRLKKNLIDFMRSESYPEELIKKIVERAQDYQTGRLRKGVLRWVALSTDKTEDTKLKIKVFDFLRMLVEHRKVMRHWLIFSNNRVQWGKADMQEVWSKWRVGDTQRAAGLEERDFKSLKDQNLAQAQTILALADEEAESDTVLKHMNIQRDELLEHYVRAQKLGLALCSDNLVKGKAKFFNCWKELLKGARQQEQQKMVMSGVEEMAAVKDEKRKIEKENETLANENQELRTFSMDGFKIAQNVTSLAGEREKLTIDLADQAETIKKLLEENLRLQDELDKVLAGNKNPIDERENFNMPPSRLDKFKKKGASIRAKGGP